MITSVTDKRTFTLTETGEICSRLKKQFPDLCHFSTGSCDGAEIIFAQGSSGLEESHGEAIREAAGGVHVMFISI